MSGSFPAQTGSPLASTKDESPSFKDKSSSTKTRSSSSAFPSEFSSSGFLSEGSVTQSSPRTWVPGRESTLEKRILRKIRQHNDRGDTDAKIIVNFVIDFDHDQYIKSHKKGADTNLNWAYTLTGFRNIVQASTALDYMSQTWPQTGARLYSYLDLRLRQSSYHRFRVQFAGNGGANITVHLDKETPDLEAETCHLSITASGHQNLVASVASQIAWFCGAFRKSPEDGLIYCKPTVSETLHFDSSDSSSDDSMRFNIGYIDTPIDGSDLDVPRTCWNGLFIDQPHTRIVCGYPIRVQPGYAFNSTSVPLTGLEITWKIIMRIREDETPVERPQNLATTPVVVHGKCFFLISKVLNKGVVFWHLERRYDHEGSEFRLDNLPRPEVSSDFDFDQLENYRHFIGGECGVRKLFVIEGRLQEGFTCPD
ncbi:Putative protein of unknown function [Podospora comata]|uniref:Uncharacterized protein n=1 Tax=Podospora comata TaxID=48703 RepID=A0ABY6S235_PODCO|nr:Putative protein of unknown function [Podospora comata]